ncbi:MAG: glycerophosphodiester phosphodiesterase [Gemmatimonadota bacterium]|nr:MAG: glycerophosphodiester phosphodiesterase [Gemmatimonadota bacterium]
MILLDTTATPVIAHRGASGCCPENTLLAFETGLDQGADALELDVRLSADGIPVVIHDAEVDRTTTGSGPVSGFTAEELARLDAGAGQGVPRLEEVLTALPAVPLIIEVKETMAAPAVASTLELHGVGDRVLVGSFEQQALRPFSRAGFPRAASRQETARFWLGSRIGWAPRGRGFAAFTVPVQQGRVTVVDRSFAKWAGRRGKPVHVWTVDDRSEAERLRMIGVQGIITNFPERMRNLPTS